MNIFDIKFGEADLKEVQPNSVQPILTGKSGRKQVRQRG